MSGREAKGEKLLQEAQNALNRFTLFGWGSESKHEDAAEYFEKAATQYKAAKNAAKSAHCYQQAAVNLEKIKNTLEATTQWKNAAVQLSIAGETEQAVKCYNKAVN